MNGNLVSSRDKRGNATLVKYDALNRPVEKRIPLETDSSGNIAYSIERYGYDPAGNLARKTLAGTRDKLDTREISYT